MSNAADAATGVVSAYEDKLNSVNPTAVWIQLGLMGSVGLLALIAFSLLRPKNSVIYQPRAKYSEDGKQPPKISKGYLTWIAPLLHTKEAILMDTIGLDAVCFLRFLRMTRNMFIAIALLACAVLLPINIAYNLNNVASKNRTYLSMLTIQDVRGSWLWGHVAVTYLITFVVFYFIWTNYAAMVHLRWQWFRSDEYQNSLHSRSLLITQVNKAHKSDAGLAQLLSSLAIPYPTTAVHIGRKVGVLPELVEQHNAAVRSLEGFLTTYFKNPDSLPAARPTMRIGGTMGFGGEKVDAIDHLTQKIHMLEERIEAARQRVRGEKAENYGFASFESVPYAHIVAKMLEGKRQKGSHFDLAPVPTDIIWENLVMDEGKRTRSKISGSIILVVFCFFYTLPLLAVSLMANIVALSAYVKFIDVWSTDYPVLMSAFIGIVPPLLSVLLQLLLPMVMRWIATYQGATTLSQTDRVVTARYSAFLFISQFFIFSLLGVLVQVISKLVVQISGNESAAVIWSYVQTIPNQLQNTWIIQSTYWLTVFPLRGSSAIFDLAQVVSLLIVWVRTRLFGRTPREIREWTKPPEFDYAVYFSNHLLMVVVGFVYAPLAPLVPLFAAVAFAISSWVYKYQLMYVFISRVETGGRLWRVIVNRILFALMMMQALMLLTVGLQVGWLYSIACAPTLISVVAFKIVMSKHFDQRYRWFIPSDAEIAEAHLHAADARKHRLEKRFGHPSLHEALFTPMLHRNVQHLLPTIYTGRIGQKHGTVDGKSVEQNTIAGLTFNMLDSHELAFDRGAYLRERDEDAQTVSSAAQTPFSHHGSKNGGLGDDYFNMRGQDYANRSAYAQTADDLPYEMQLRPRPTLSHAPQGSTDNLIQYPPRWDEPPPPSFDPNYSQQSFESYNHASVGGVEALRPAFRRGDSRASDRVPPPVDGYGYPPMAVAPSIGAADERYPSQQQAGHGRPYERVSEGSEVDLGLGGGR